ncbi:MAG: hypothetical protein R3E42_06995 [Burkholderiaceae bacterium]
MALLWSISGQATHRKRASADVGKVTNPSALTGQNYSVTFANVAGATQYTVTNTTTATPVPGLTGVPYVDGNAIEFDGMSFVVKGSPSAGDTIDVSTPAAPTDIFQVMQDAIDALRTSGDGAFAGCTRGALSRRARRRHGPHLPGA